MEDKTINELVDLANKNNVDAIYELGIRYWDEKDYDKALIYFRKAEQAGSIKAKYRIADSYYYGNGANQDYQKAFEIYKEIYEKTKGKYALMQLIAMYYFGRGVEQNYQKVIQYGEEFEKNNNDEYVAYYLGIIYFYGKDVEKNYKKAKMYFEKSIDDRYDDVYYHLGLIYKYGGYRSRKR